MATAAPAAKQNRDRSRRGGRKQKPTGSFRGFQGKGGCCIPGQWDGYMDGCWCEGHRPLHSSVLLSMPQCLVWPLELGRGCRKAAAMAQGNGDDDGGSQAVLRASLAIVLLWGHLSLCLGWGRSQLLVMDQQQGQAGAEDTKPILVWGFSLNAVEKMKPQVGSAGGAIPSSTSQSLHEDKLLMAAGTALYSLGLMDWIKSKSRAPRGHPAALPPSKMLHSARMRVNPSGNKTGTNSA